MKKFPLYTLAAILFALWFTLYVIYGKDMLMVHMLMGLAGFALAVQILLHIASVKVANSPMEKQTGVIIWHVNHGPIYHYSREKKQWLSERHVDYKFEAHTEQDYADAHNLAKKIEGHGQLHFLRDHYFFNHSNK